MNIAAACKKSILVRHHFCKIAAVIEEIWILVFLPIVVAVALIDETHHFSKWYFRRTDKQMIMVCHNAIDNEGEWIFFVRIMKDTKPFLNVCLISKNVLSIIPAHDNMVEHARISVPSPPSHLYPSAFFGNFVLWPSFSISPLLQMHDWKSPIPPPNRQSFLQGESV